MVEDTDPENINHLIGILLEGQFKSRWSGSKAQNVHCDIICSSYDSKCEVNPYHVPFTALKISSDMPYTVYNLKTSTVTCEGTAHHLRN